jgi:acyl-CoA thioesterase FadM
MSSTGFRARYPVRVGDINYGGHLGNDKYLLLFHDARLAYLAAWAHRRRTSGAGPA